MEAIELFSQITLLKEEYQKTTDDIETAKLKIEKLTSDIEIEGNKHAQISEETNKVIE